MHHQVNFNGCHNNNGNDNELDSNDNDNERQLLIKSKEKTVNNYSCHEQSYSPNITMIPAVTYEDEGDNYQDSNLMQNNSDNSMSKVLTSIQLESNITSLNTSETSISIALQIFFPFMVAGFGTVFAGLLLDLVQHWKVYKDVPEVYILVPALLGLKGNLEMTFASRLSTAANVGKMDCSKRKWSIILGNMALTQAQALVVAVLASLLAIILRWVVNGLFSLEHAFLLCSSALITASITSAILGSIMVAVVVFSHNCGINPDNIATPIAASLGDLVTLALLSVTSNFLYNLIGSAHHWVAPVVCFLFIFFLPIWVYISHHNIHTHHILYTGWWPVILAMCISSAGGLILSSIVSENPGIAVFSPVINGVGGNLVAVQASRLATYLHIHSEIGNLPHNTKFGLIATFCTSGVQSRSSRVLLALCIPGHIIFLVLISNLNAGHMHPTYVFIGFYLLAGLIQVGFLLFICNFFVHWLWKSKKDPDNYSIPFLTAIGDLLGTALLTGAFKLNDLVKSKYHL